MQFELREKNSSKKYISGSMWTTKHCGSLEIVGQINKRYTRPSGISTFRHFLCEFGDGFLVVSTATAIKNGLVFNPYYKKVSGVGFIGEGAYKSRDKSGMTREYSIWKSMIYRCYSPNAFKGYPSYSDCLVDSRWHNFQNFSEDILSLEGYNRWFLNIEKMELDKDIKIKGNRLYSKDTCMFVTKKENTDERNSRLRT